MPSPVLMLAFVVNGKTLPQPPVHRMTALAVIACDPAGDELDRHHAVHPAVVDEQPGDEPLVVPRRPRRTSARSGTACAACGSRSCRRRTRCASSSCRRTRGPRRARPAAGSTGSPSARAAAAPGAPRRRTPRSRPGRRASRCRRWCRRCARRCVSSVGDHAGGAALGGHRVAAHRVDLGDHGDVGGAGWSRRWRWRRADRRRRPRPAARRGRRRTRPSLTAQLLVHQHLAVVVHDHEVDAAVVELLPVAAGTRR